MSFPGIIGHERVMDRLAHAAAIRKPHHAYIFHGPDGIGRRMVAIGFAMALNCDDLQDGKPCGRCSSCRRIAAGTDADVWTTSPTPPKDRPQGNLALRIGDVRELQSRLAFKTSDDRYRVVVIDDVELMTNEAANSLLKTLEEPPDRTVLVLITRRLAQMLPTVRSRCLQVSFARLPVEAVEHYLVEQRQLPPEEARQLAAVSGGAIGRTQGLSLETVALERDLLQRFFQATAGSDAQRLALAEELDKAETEARKEGGRLMRNLVGALGQVLRDATASRAGYDGPPWRPDCAELARDLCNGYDSDTLLRAFHAVQRAHDRLERHMSTRLVIEALLLEIG